MDRIIRPSTVTAVQAPPELFSKVMRRLELEQKLVIMRRRFAVTAVLSLLVLALIVPVWQIFQSDLTASGFGQYLAVAFYNYQAAFSNWGDFGLTLLETLPVMSLVELLIVVLVWLVTLKFVARYGRFMSERSPHFTID